MSRAQACGVPPIAPRQVIVVGDTGAFLRLL